MYHSGRDGRYSLHNGFLHIMPSKKIKNGNIYIIYSKANDRMKRQVHADLTASSSQDEDENERTAIPNPPILQNTIYI